MGDVRPSGEGYWSQSGCCCPTRPDVWWKGRAGSGSEYWTERFGTYWVGATHATYASQNYECGALGAPVKSYGYLSEFGAYGQWFEGGAIYYKFGRWNITLGNFGQTSGRFRAVMGKARVALHLYKTIPGAEAPEPPTEDIPPPLPDAPGAEQPPDAPSPERTPGDGTG